MTPDAQGPPESPMRGKLHPSQLADADAAPAKEVAAPTGDGEAVPAKEAAAPTSDGWESWGDETRRARVGEAHDVRALRIANAASYSSSVANYRKRQQQQSNSTESATSSSATARVFARARPLAPHETERHEWECVSCSPVTGDLAVHSASERMVAGKGCVKRLAHQIYPGVTPLVTEEDVYGAVVYLVQAAVQGDKSTLFMYGMTGSGKTHSMAGIHQRAPADLFKDRVCAEENSIKLTAYELVGKKCFDLLSDNDASGTKREVFLRVGEDGNTHICGNSERPVTTPEELQQMLQLASSARETAATGTNATSSRSHAVYQVLMPHGGRCVTQQLWLRCALN